MTNSDRKRLGAVYTPPDIVETILDSAGLSQPDQLKESGVCDPSCGDGAFLTAAARRMLNRLRRSDALNALRRLTGYDINPEAVAACRAKLDALLQDRYPDERVHWRLRVCNAFDRSALRDEWGRFSHVVGNPPYIRVQHLEQSGRRQVAGQWEILGGSYDSYLLFFELGLELLRPGGTLGYIAPSSWMRSRAGGRLRKTLALSHTVTKIIDFNDRQIFEGVTTYTAVVVIRKGGSTRRIAVTQFNGGCGAVISVDAVDPSRPWTALTSKDRERMDRLTRRGPRLGEIADIHVGIQTLADSVFIVSIDRCRQAERGVAVCGANGDSALLEPWILRPIVKASVMKNGRDPVERAVLYPYDAHGRLLPERFIAEKAPAAYAWLVRRKERLLKRDKGKIDPERWYAYGRSVSIASGFGDKILTAAMNRRPNFQRCADPDATFYSGYCVKPTASIDMDRLLSVLNSDDMDFFIRRIAQPYQSGWMSYAKSFIQRFPVPLDLL